jgi:RimJ/RimL family protein N-acetyltransferase
MARLPDRIETPRLLLRRWTADDAALLNATIAANLDHLRPWMPWVADEPLSLDSRLQLLEMWRETWEAEGDVVLGILRGDAIVGSTGLHRRRGPDVLEIGYWIAAQHGGNVYATEVARALTSVAFTVDGIARVEIHHDKANVKSARVPEKLGFTRVGETPDEITSPGEVGIDVAWSIARDEWSARSSTSS